MQENSVMYIIYTKWIHKQCSGMRGGLSLVIDDIRCSMVHTDVDIDNGAR